MNDHFFALPEEKQNRILNAAMAVFSKSDYKHALTDDIAAQAGISKGLLFYYFKNKKTLYTYLFDFGVELMKNQLRIPELLEETDFFEIMLCSQSIKLSVLNTHPYYYAFIRRAYYEPTPQLDGQIQAYTRQALEKSSQTLLDQIDKSKFKDGVDPFMVIQMVFWCAEGYMKTKFENGTPEPDALAEEFAAYLTMMKQQFYKEEALL